MVFLYAIYLNRTIADLAIDATWIEISQLVSIQADSNYYPKIGEGGKNMSGILATKNKKRKLFHIHVKSLSLQIHHT
jgi:hypothetical protein